MSDRDELLALAEVMRRVEYDMLHRRLLGSDGFVAERTEVATIITALRSTHAEIQALRSALAASDYLGDLYQQLWKGGVVRDLAEATAARDSARLAIASMDNGGSACSL